MIRTLNKKTGLYEAEPIRVSKVFTGLADRVTTLEMQLRKIAKAKTLKEIRTILT